MTVNEPHRLTCNEEGPVDQPKSQEHIVHLGIVAHFINLDFLAKEFGDGISVGMYVDIGPLLLEHR